MIKNYNTSLSIRRSFPSVRMRRNRESNWVRSMIAENTIKAADLIWPVFTVEGKNQCQPVPSMPGVNRYSTDTLINVVGQARDLGINCIALFPHLDKKLKTPDARESYNPNNLVCRSIKAVKSAYPDIGVFCDVALDPFNSDGHDGLLDGNSIVNDETVEVLCKQAVVQAQAGCDIIGPSDMMDGRIGAIRNALDKEGYIKTIIVSYAAKYASGFYGPFRDAIGSGSLLNGDKKTYQLDPANSDEALHEVALDINEGADMVMVKPGLPYLDILSSVKSTFSVPTCAYNVSGEYAMLKAASENEWLDYSEVIIETMLSFKRAGADAILTYSALDVAQIISDDKL